MVELGKRLVTYQNVKVTTFVTSFLGSAATISRMVQSAQSEKLFDVIQLPPADISGLISPGQTGLASLPAVVRVSEPAFRSAISALETPPTALVAHVYAVDCLGIADELKIPKFVYMSSHAWYLALFLYVPILDKNVGGELGDDDQKEPFVLPGCTPVRPEDLPDPMLVQTKNNYLELIRMATEIPKADGILVNTWEELQPTTLAALRDDKLLGSVAKAPIFPIGPVTAEGAVGSKSELSGWLDKQPNESVLYISFGSMGALSLEQMTELAWGLELSQQRFFEIPAPSVGVLLKEIAYARRNFFWWNLAAVGFIDDIGVFMADMEGRNAKAHAVLLSSPGLGHLIPVLELGKRLVTVNNFKVTIFVVSSLTAAAESQVLQSSMSPELCEVIRLPPANISDLVDADAAVVTRIAVLMREIRPALSSAISALKYPPTVLIVDLFGTESLGFADDFKIPKFVFIPSHAWFLALTIYLPRLDEVVKGEYVDEKEALFIPGCRPVQPEDVVDPMMCRSDQQYAEYVHMGMNILMADGILVSTWEELEPETLAALRDNKLLGRISKVPIYPIGPMIRPIGAVDHSSKKLLFDWLDQQPSVSVLFVSFGSGGMLSNEQMRELAWGLELSRQRFIWVVRTPAVKSGDGSFFSVGSGSSNDKLSFLPEGFLGRTQNLGLQFLMM
ncbi:hypothetical protein QUC31_002984 [Theobroma cacao]